MKIPSFASILLMLSLLAGRTCSGQDSSLDSLFAGYDPKTADSLKKSFDEFLSGFNSSKSFVSLTLTAANGYYDFKRNNSVYLKTGGHFVMSPGLGCYHKSGLALSASAFGVQAQQQMTWYQMALSPSYAYTTGKNVSAGVAYTHYFTKDSLDFYTTPLDDEVYGWFTVKKFWIEPGLAFAYGWGTQEQLKRRYYLVTAEQAYVLRRVSSQVSVRDYALSFSLKHDFFIYHMGSGSGSLLITPLLLISSGTQNFGFNTTYAFNAHVINSFYVSPAANEATSTGFMVRSLTCILSADYAVRKFFVQPQLVLDYCTYEHNTNPLRFIAALSFGFNL